jgi:hypothetical protein
MREQEVRELYEAYRQVHQPQEEVEQLDEGYQRNPEKDPDYVPSGERPTRRQRMNDPRTGINSPAFQDFYNRQMGGKKKKKVDEETDLFDTILEYLVAEGYADTNEAALAIMANMSEEWRQSIVEQSAIGARAAKVVDDQRQGYHGDSDAINKLQDAASRSMGRLKKGQGPVVTPGLPGV